MIFVLSQLFVIFFTNWIASGVHLSNFCDEAFVWLKIFVRQQNAFETHQDHEKDVYYKKTDPYFIAWVVPDWKKATSLFLVKRPSHWTKNWKNYLFFTALPATLQSYAKKLEVGKIFEYVPTVNFDFVDLLKDNSLVYLLFFDEFQKLCDV